jgi:hypothetical protein
MFTTEDTDSSYQSRFVVDTAAGRSHPPHPLGGAAVRSDPALTETPAEIFPRIPLQVVVEARPAEDVAAIIIAETVRLGSRADVRTATCCWTWNTCC